MAKLLQFIEEQQPDILCAQEVLDAQKGSEISIDHDIHRQLSERFNYKFYAPTIHFSLKNDLLTTGNAIYSNWPIKNVNTVFTSGVGVSTQTSDQFDYNIRNIQLCEILLPNTSTLSVANYHGYHETNPFGSIKSITSMKCAANAVSDIKGPLIVCGDFNVNPQSPAMRSFNDLELRNLTVEQSTESTLSEYSHVRIPVVCDYILASNDILVEHFGVSQQIISDHKALILEFEISNIY